MIPQMIRNEGRDEVVAMVVSRLPSQRQGIAHVACGLFEQLGTQLHVEKLIGRALVDENRWATLCVLQSLQQHRGIVSVPLAAIRAQVTSERLLSPWHVI